MAASQSFEEMATRVEGWLYVSVDDGRVGRSTCLHPPFIEQWHQAWIRRYAILDPDCRTFFLQEKSRGEGPAFAARRNMHVAVVETGALPGPRRMISHSRAEAFFPDPDPDAMPHSLTISPVSRKLKSRALPLIPPPASIAVEGVNVRPVHPSVFENHEEFVNVFQISLPSTIHGGEPLRLLCRCVHIQEKRAWMKGFHQILHSKGFYQLLQLNVLVTKALGLHTRGPTLTQLCFGPFLNAQTSPADAKKSGGSGSVIWRESFSFPYLSPSDTTLSMRVLSLKRDLPHDVVAEGTLVVQEMEEKRESAHELTNRGHLHFQYTYSVLNVFPLETYEPVFQWFEKYGFACFDRLGFASFHSPELDLGFYRSFAAVFVGRSEAYNPHATEPRAALWLERWMQDRLVGEWERLHTRDVEQLTCTIRSQAGGNSILDKVLEGYIMTLGRQYLQDTFYDLVATIFEEIGYKPIKESKREEAVRRYIQQIWNLLATGEFPPRLKRFFVDISRQARAHNIPPEFYHFRLRSCMFLRFFCPAVLSPHECGITHRVPDTHTQEVLKAVADGFRAQAMANHAEGPVVQINPADEFCRRVYEEDKGRSERHRIEPELIPATPLTVCAASIVQAMLRHLSTIRSVIEQCENEEDKESILLLCERLDAVKALHDEMSSPQHTPARNGAEEDGEDDASGGSGRKKSLVHHDSAPSLRPDPTNASGFPRMMNEFEGNASDSDVPDIPSRSPGTASPGFMRSSSSPVPRRVPSLQDTPLFRSLHRNNLGEHHSSQESLREEPSFCQDDGAHALSEKDLEVELLKIENANLKRDVLQANARVRELEEQNLFLRSQVAALSSAATASAGATAAVRRRSRSFVNSPEATTL